MEAEMKYSMEVSPFTPHQSPFSFLFFSFLFFFFFLIGAKNEILRSSFRGCVMQSTSQHPSSPTTACRIIATSPVSEGSVLLNA
ncbi:hypothetical protein BO83DRAFT_244933 [Aspergillus eucalypticola CBS 122712]|uniref:Uncharacterized protein n=1 Tax=Aspergillus eucalypticola (strain CBS 122712 / IBT 29274) TaxID=1448314 RepID=A0A317VMQ1_ASPEC|nr:uncharacterized protein BO83DRAFT_244933 [Aspergillus eucalypticola CBS 122712]PWY75613.1 hypothetical protein BO83DRAFT_244933 [Aspergillus eucalypticola CBS 122712]